MTSLPEPQPTAGDDEVRQEQAFVDQAYAVLDDLRNHYRQEQQRAAETGAQGTPQAVNERDVFFNHYGEAAARLEQVEDRLVFGRLDMTDASRRYIGRVGLRAQENGEEIQLLMDWRAPAAKPFYQATARTPMEVVRRRHIATSLRRVTRLEDELLGKGGAGNSLQGEGALMAALSQARDGHMTDIVETIQAEQDEIIRRDIDGVLVVQGGPGTGKTAVALHRAAYLLYTYRERLARSGVLLVGPSKLFLRYIEQVLPSLGETGVVSTTMAELLPGLRASAVDTREVAQIKGRLVWRDIAKRAVATLQRLPREPQTLQIGSKRVIFAPELVKEAMDKARRTGKLHNIARETFALTCVELLTDVYAAEKATSEDRPWYREDVRESKDARRAINLCWMPTSPETLLERLYAYPEILRQVAPELSESERAALARPKGSEWTVSDIPILDEFSEQLGPFDYAQQRKERRARAAQREQQIARAQEAISGQELGGGIVTAKMLSEHTQAPAERDPLAVRARQDRTWTYGHVIVDEAHELSPLAWHSLVRRCPSLSFTVVGDVDQRSDTSASAEWEELLGPLARAEVEMAYLTIAYRAPATLMHLAKRVMEANGQPLYGQLQAPRDLPNCLDYTDAGGTDLEQRTRGIVDAEVARLDAELGAGRGRVAVVADGRRTREWQTNGNFGDNPIYDRVTLLAASDSKGLEFDTIVMVEPAEIAAESLGDLYVALTRATRRLHVVHAQPLPAGFRN